MAKSKRDRYESERSEGESSIEGLRERGEITDDTADAILEFLDAKDPQRTATVDHTDDGTKSDSTLVNYANTLKLFCQYTGADLMSASPDEINKAMDDLRNGRVDGVKDDGLGAGTIKGYQGTLRKFYEYHGTVDKEEINLLNPQDSKVDERDVFTKEEIQAIRDAAGNPRDKALIDMLFYTGQRLSALLNLRIRDVKPDEGTSGIFYLNEEAGDLKGASGKRPLLYAQKAARAWKRQHPKKNDPDAHFITHKYNWENREYGAGDRLDNSTVYRQIQRIAKRAANNTEGMEWAELKRKAHPHNFRHTFVTICKRNYGMDNDTIKRLIGHSEESTIMESTYTHITDSDVIDDAERDMDLRDDEPESPLTPDVCDNCNEPVPIDNAKACPSCGQLFTPDAEAAQEEMQEQAEDKVVEVDNEQEAKIVAEILEGLREDPSKFLDE